MLGSFFDQRDEDKTHKVIGHALMEDDILDFLDQENGRHTHKRRGNGNGNQTLREREFASPDLIVAVLIIFLVQLEDIIKNGLMASKVEKQEAEQRLRLVHTPQTCVSSTHNRNATRRITAVALLIV